MQILDSSTVRGKLNRNRLRLYVKMDNDVWLVDQEGAVSKNGVETQLSDDKYKELRYFPFGRLPYNTLPTFAKSN